MFEFSDAAELSSSSLSDVRLLFDLVVLVVSGTCGAGGGGGATGKPLTALVPKLGLPRFNAAVVAS